MIKTLCELFWNNKKDNNYKLQLKRGRVAATMSFHVPKIARKVEL